VAREVAEAGGGAAAYVDVPEEGGGAPALDHALDDLGQGEGEGPGKGQVQRHAGPPEAEGQRRRDRDGDEVAQLHHEPDDGEQGRGKVVEEAERVLLQDRQVLAGDGHGGDRQECEPEGKPDGVAGMATVVTDPALGESPLRVSGRFTHGHKGEG
jgi:hypothetical protein